MTKEGAGVIEKEVVAEVITVGIAWGIIRVWGG